MSAQEFDLDDPPPVLDDETPAARRRRQRRERSGGGEEKEKPKPKPSPKAETDLRGRLEVAFGKLADQLRARNDEELADAFDEGKEAISQSLVTMTATIRWMRKPLLLFVGFLEPVLAFWRIGRILLGRLIMFRDHMAQQEVPEPYAVPDQQPVQ